MVHTSTILEYSIIELVCTMVHTNVIWESLIIKLVCTMVHTKSCGVRGQLAMTATEL